MFSNQILCFELYPTDCMDGYYPDANFCRPCSESANPLLGTSWKQCSQPGEWDTWEDYMFYNPSTRSCEFCPDGEFYSQTSSTCEVWTSCDGACKSQISCLQCSPGELLDLETLTWGTTCNGIILDGPMFSVGPIWRNLASTLMIQYYVDPHSSEVLELGTYQYPFRSLKAVNYEILTFLSHSVSAVMVYTKSLYIEDGTNFYMNMTAVSFAPHPDSLEVPTLIPTAIVQPMMFLKTGFHLYDMNFVDFEASMLDVLSRGTFTDYELGLLQMGGITILPIRTSLLLSNFKIYREEVVPNNQLVFINAGNLQFQGVSIGKSQQ